MRDPLVTIGYVAAHLASYFALEYGVVERSIEQLSAIVGAEGAELAAWEVPVETRAQAAEAARFMRDRGVDLVLLQSASFAMGDVVLPFADEGLRLGLWAVEEPLREGPILLNNFVSMNLHAGVLRSYLRDLSGAYKWFFGLDDHPWFAPRLRVTLSALNAIRRLEGARIGWVGGLAPSFVNLAFDERSLRETLGIEVARFDLGAVIMGAERIDGSEVAGVVAAMRAAGEDRVSDPEAVTKNAAVALSLRDLARKHELDALAVSDWPTFQEAMGIHPGMAFSWVDEADGIPVASEGDVLGAATMLLLRGATAGPAMLLDVNDVDVASDAVLTWHCGGSPLAMADDEGVRWTDHTTLGRKQADATSIGAVADLQFRRGPVTLARLGDSGRDLFRLEGEVIDGPAPGFDGSRGWIGRLRDGGQAISAADFVNTILARGIDHHFVVAPGHAGSVLDEVAVWLDLTRQGIVPYADALQFPDRRDRRNRHV
jgi:hypothetical protein